MRRRSARGRSDRRARWPQRPFEEDGGQRSRSNPTDGSGMKVRQRGCRRGQQRRELHAFVGVLMRSLIRGWLQMKRAIFVMVVASRLRVRDRMRERLRLLRYTTRRDADPCLKQQGDQHGGGPGPLQHRCEFSRRRGPEL
mgnify:FL=1